MHNFLDTHGNQFKFKVFCRITCLFRLYSNNLFILEQSQTDVEDNLLAGAGGFCVPVIKR